MDWELPSTYSAARMDVGWKRAKELVDEAAAQAERAFRPDALHAVARRFGEDTSRHGREQLDRQLRAAIGVPLSAIERPAVDKLDEFAARNVDLIKTVPERCFDRLRLDVLEAFEEGTNVDELTDRLEERFDMAEGDARRIARDQIGKLNAQLNQERLEGLGVEEFVWRTVNDQRVRPEHAELEGQTFRFDDPPIIEGEAALPGEQIECRCYPEPILGALAELSSDIS